MGAPPGDFFRCHEIDQWLMSHREGSQHELYPREGGDLGRGRGQRPEGLRAALRAVQG